MASATIDVYLDHFETSELAAELKSRRKIDEDAIQYEDKEADRRAALYQKACLTRCPVTGRPTF